MKTIRIFISSPGDVAEERERARQVIEGLKRRYASVFHLKPVLWEELPLQADMSFQQGIDLVLSRDQGIEIAVFILWSRLGSPLGSVICKPDGSEYRSGTEREFDLMLEARLQSGGQRPAFLVYTRRDETTFEEGLRGKKTEVKEELILQKKRVESFLQEEFHDGGSGHNVRAYHSFDRPQTFSQRLRVHLTELLDELAGDAVAQAVWDIGTQGPPFLGLQAFQSRHAGVFFGREDEVLEARRALAGNARSGCAFLLITGASGSGKSSLARAGLLPAVAEHELDETVAEWRSLTVTPAELGADPVADLMERLAAPSLLPTLRTEGADFTDVIDGFRKHAESAVRLLLKPAVAMASRHRSGGVRVLLLLDQLEEVFAMPQRAECLALIEALARSGVVWVVATVRGDFLGEVHADPTLARLLEGRPVLPLMPPGPDALRRMIEEPALQAGLRFEPRGERRLSDQILADAARHCDLLPLVEFVLLRLYEHRSADHQLSWKVYEQELGGVEGALRRRADEVFEALPSDQQAALPTLMKRLVNLAEARGDSEDGAERFIRQRVRLSEFPEQSPVRRLVDTLVRERLLTAAGSNGEDEGSVTVAHEALLRVWPRAAAWAEGNRDLLRTRARVVARRIEAECIAEGDPLLNLARIHLEADPEAFGADLQAYIRHSQALVEASEKRRESRRRRGMAGMMALSLCAIVSAGLALKREQEAEGAREIAVAAQKQTQEEKLRTERQLEFSQLEEGRFWLERARRALANKDPIAAQMFAARAVGLVDEGQGEDDPPSWKQKYPALLGQVFKDPEAEKSRLGEVVLVKDFLRSISPTCLPIWSSPANTHHRGSVESVAFSPDGSRLASGAGDKTAKLWDVATGKERVTFQGHSEWVNTVAFSPDGARLATGSWDKTVKIWDVATGEELASLEGHTEKVFSVVFSLDGSRLASGSLDRTVKLWDVTTGEELATLAGHSAWVASVAFSPDGSRLATGSGDKTAKLWDVATSKELATFQRHSDRVVSVAFSPDGNRLATGSWDKTVTLWNVTTGEEQATLHLGMVKSVAFSPDGRRLVAGSRDKNVTLWDAATGEKLAIFQGHANDVNSVVFSPDGSRLATGSWDRTVKIWDMATGEEQVILPAQPLGVNSVAFSPDGSRLASGSWDKTVKLWDVASGEELATLEGHSGSVLSLAFSPDGSRLATGSGDKTVKLWHVVSGEELATFRGHSEGVSSVAFSPDGSRLATGSLDETVKLWDVASGKEQATLQGHSAGVASVAFSPDGSRLATGSWDETVKLWDVATGKEQAILQEHSGGVSSVAFSPDGSRLASGGGDKTVKLWDVATGRELSTLRGHLENVHSVAFSPDGSRLATGSGDKTVKLWDAASGKELATLWGHLYGVGSVAFSSDGSRLASGSADKVVKFWDMATGEELATYNGHAEVVRSVAFSPDGSRLATGSGDKTVKLLDVASGKELATLQGHLENVLSVAFSPDGSRLATGSGDNTVKLWDVVTGKVSATLQGYSEWVRNVTFSPDGSRLATVSGDGAVKLWDVVTGKVLATLQGHSERVIRVAFSPDGRHLALATRNKAVKLWDVAMNKEQALFQGHSADVNSVAFSPDGSRLASGSWDRTVKFWDVATGEELATLQGHVDGVTSVAFSPDGSRLATGSGDKTVKLWDVATGEELATLQGHVDGVTSVAYHPDGRRLASGSVDKTVKIWDTTTGKEQARKPPFSLTGEATHSRGNHKNLTLAALVKGILQLEQKGYLELFGREVDWCTNDSLFSSRSFEPVFWRQDLLAQIAAAETEAERWRLRLQLCGKGGQWRALPTVWSEARRSGLGSEEAVRHEFVVQALIASWALLSQGAPQAPESLWQALLESAKPEDWQDPRFTLPLAQAVPAVLKLPDAVDALCQTLIRKVSAEAPVTWLEAVAEGLKSEADEESQVVTARRHDFLRSAADRHPSSAILLRIALVTHAETAPERLAMEDRLLLLPDVVSGDFANAAYGAAQRGDTARTKRLLEMAVARFDADETVHRMAGWSYLNLAEPDAARKAFEAARERLNAEQKPDGDLLAGLAISQWQTSDREAAVASYKALIETGRAQDESKDWTDAGVVVELMATEIEKKPLEEIRQATLAKFPELRN